MPRSKDPKILRRGDPSDATQQPSLRATDVDVLPDVERRTSQTIPTAGLAHGGRVFHGMGGYARMPASGLAAYAALPFLISDIAGRLSEFSAIANRVKPIGPGHTPLASSIRDR